MTEPRTAESLLEEAAALEARVPPATARPRTEHERMLLARAAELRQRAAAALEGTLPSMLAAIRRWDPEIVEYYELTPRLQVAFDVTRDEPLTLAHNDDTELGEIPLTPRAAFELQQILDAYTRRAGIAN